MGRLFFVKKKQIIILQPKIRKHIRENNIIRQKWRAFVSLLTLYNARKPFDSQDIIDSNVSCKTYETTIRTFFHTLRIPPSLCVFTW